MSVWVKCDQCGAMEKVRDTNGYIGFADLPSFWEETDNGHRCDNCDEPDDDDEDLFQPSSFSLPDISSPSPTFGGGSFGGGGAKGKW